jgi:hypothetical protein
LHDVIGVSVGRGSGIEIRCEDPRVPKDESNTCYSVVERAMQALGAKGRGCGCREGWAGRRRMRWLRCWGWSGR